MTTSGTVYLVGAGPGDPELLTLKAMRLIETADVVVYDRLVSSQVLSLIPQNIDRIDVGKSPGSHPVPQKSINSILIKLAKSGQNVVRLKGGDPMIFGRGGEEVEMLNHHGIKVITVPGITAAQGCAASMNLPLTQRGIANSLIYITGHAYDDNVPEMDWENLAQTNTTLVIYMGVAKIAEITRKLMNAGLPTSTPAIAISSGTLAKQDQIISTVSLLATDANKANLSGPVLFILGQVVSQVSGQVIGQIQPNACANGELENVGAIAPAALARV